MALEITKTFVVDATPDVVWAFLTDPHRVAQCMPGAQIGDPIDDKTWAGTMKVKVGPVTSTYRGRVVFEDLDATALRAVITASGQDVKGKGGADMRMTSQLVSLGPGRTEVTAVSSLNVSGILAQMGRGMIEDVSDQIFKVFTQRMRTSLAAVQTTDVADPTSESASISDTDTTIEKMSATSARRSVSSDTSEPGPDLARVLPDALSADATDPSEADLTATMPETPALKPPVTPPLPPPAKPGPSPAPRRASGAVGALPSGGWAPIKTPALDAAVERLESAAGQLESAAARLESAQARLSHAADRFDAALAEHRALVDSGRGDDVLDLGPMGARAMGRAALRNLKSPVFWIVAVMLALVLSKLFD